MTVLTRFRNDVRGNVGIVLALALAPVLMASGMAVDFARASGVKSRMQAALDAGALAAAASKTLSEKARKEIALKAFSQNFDAGDTQGLKADPHVEILDGAVSMSATLAYPTAFMRVAGIASMDLGVSVEVSLPEQKKAEIAMVLDYSSSMLETAGGRVKYIAMRDAATKLVEDLTEKGENENVKFGLVPFSHHVYVTLPSGHVVGQRPGSTWTGCTQDRKFPHNRTDDTPVADDDDTKWGHPQAPEHRRWGCDAYAPNKLMVRPIGTDIDLVTRQLGQMRPYQYTHIALGFEFGWHLVSPTAPFKDVAPYGDENTMKVIVLLTDGRQTEPGFGRGGKRDQWEGEKNLARLCDNAKEEGVRVVTVAFDLRETGTLELLRDCATDPDKDFFIADDNKQLAGAFEEIKAQLAAGLYISK